MCYFTGFLTLLSWSDMPSSSLPFTSHRIGPYATQANARLWTNMLSGLLSDRQAQGELSSTEVCIPYTWTSPRLLLLLQCLGEMVVPWHSVACLISLDNKIDKLAFITVGKCSLIAQPMSLLCLMFDNKLKVGCCQDTKIQFPFRAIVNNNLEKSVGLNPGRVTHCLFYSFESKQGSAPRFIFILK